MLKPLLSRWLSDYGMVLVLALLCVFFSVVTISEQSPTGERAGRPVAEMIQQRFGKTPRVLIVGRDQPDDAAFAAALSRELTAMGGQVLATVKGEPKDARDSLLKITAAGDKLDAIACTQAVSTWLVFSDLPGDFPELGNPAVLKPQTYRWPGSRLRDGSVSDY